MNLLNVELHPQFKAGKINEKSNGKKFDLKGLKMISKFYQAVEVLVYTYLKVSL